MQVGLRRGSDIELPADAQLEWSARGRLSGGVALGRGAAVLLMTVGLLLCAAVSSRAALVHPYISQLVGEKSSKRFENVCGIYIDPVGGELIVADAGKIEAFDSTGTFLRKIRRKEEDETNCSPAVNSAKQRLYVANAGEGEPEKLGQEEAVFAYGLHGNEYAFEEQLILNGSNTPAKTFESEVEGATLGELESNGSLGVTVVPKGTEANSEDIYVSDGGQKVVDQFNSGGEYLKQLVFPTGTPQALAVGPAGELYVAVIGEEGAVEVPSLVYEYSSTGELLQKNVGTRAGGFGAISGLAVDAAGDLYVSDSAKEAVDEFDSSGNFEGRLTGSDAPEGRLVDPVGVAVNYQSGEVYVADHTAAGTSVIDIFGPAQAGATPFLESEGASSVKSTSATLEAQIDPTAVSTSYHFEYGPVGGELTSSPETSLGSGDGIQYVTLELNGLAANTTYEYRVVVSPSGQTAEAGTLKRFTTQTEGVGVSLPDHRAWELVTPVNKYGSLVEGIGAQGVVEASAEGGRIVFPAASPIEPNPAANAGHVQALAVRGSQEWTTQEILPPTYPQVGPPSISAHGDENRIFSGDLSRSIVDPFREEPLLSPQASERTPYLRDLNLTGSSCQITESACFEPLATAKGELADVTSGAPFGGPKPETGAPSIFGGITAAAASSDLQHVLLEAREEPLKNPPRTEAEKRGEETSRPYPEREESGLYEWNATSPPAERLQLVSLLPAAEGGGQAPASSKPHPGGFRANANARRAISPDGSLIVWSAEKETPAEIGGFDMQDYLYLRDTAIGQTIRLDTPKAGEDAVGLGATFQTASADDSTIFFSDEQKLTADSHAEEGKPDLYACHVRITGGQLECPPEDLTPTESGESGDVRGLVVEASEDGSDVYFVADGVLSSNKNAGGEEATPGQCGETPPPGATCNLYMEHYDGSTWEQPRFIAVLSADDGPDWAAKPHNDPRGANGKAILLAGLTARVSPNGEFLAFMSERSLTGYDNTDAAPSAAGARDEEVFLYEASANRIVCVSCDPSGARPHGVHDTATAITPPLRVDEPGDDGNANVWNGSWLAGNIPGWTSLEIESALYQSRYLSNEGRLFFNSPIGLVPQDKNSVEDVYEYEPGGIGTCGIGSGCISLISSGESSDESAFLDASESGGDVFFLTTSKLVSQDVDESYDIYDAHDCSESPCLAAATQSGACTSSAACQGSSTSSPSFSSPVSSSNPGVAPTVVAKGKPLGVTIVKPTRAQLLAKALKTCKKLKKKKKRVACERAARKKYGPKAKKKKKSKKASR
jgi:hypothetical protein